MNPALPPSGLMAGSIRGGMLRSRATACHVASKEWTLPKHHLDKSIA